MRIGLLSENAGSCSMEVLLQNLPGLSIFARRTIEELSSKHPDGFVAHVEFEMAVYDSKEQKDFWTGSGDIVSVPKKFVRIVLDLPAETP